MVQIALGRMHEVAEDERWKAKCTISGEYHTNALDPLDAWAPGGVGGRQHVHEPRTVLCDSDVADVGLDCKSGRCKNGAKLVPKTPTTSSMLRSVQELGRGC